MAHDLVINFCKDTSTIVKTASTMAAADAAPILGTADPGNALL
jgi:hypothetical protein